MSYASSAAAVNTIEQYPELAAAGLSPERQLAFARFRLWRILIPVAIWY